MGQHVYINVDDDGNTSRVSSTVVRATTVVPVAIKVVRWGTRVVEETLSGRLVVVVESGQDCDTRKHSLNENESPKSLIPLIEGGSCMDHDGVGLEF